MHADIIQENNLDRLYKWNTELYDLNQRHTHTRVLNLPVN